MGGPLAANLTRPAWSEERKERVRTLWNEGRTGGDIANILGVTRSSIMGLANRLGLLGNRQVHVTPAMRRQRKMFKQREYSQRYRAKHKPAPKFKVEKYIPRVIDAPPPHNLSLADNNGCMWPTEGLLFCGHDKFPKSSYCEAHAAASVTRG